MHRIQAAFYGALVAVAGLTAAVAAHVGIDVVGDFVLAHDTYDDVSHGSRAIFVGIALALAALLLLRWIGEALDRRSGSLTAMLRGIRAAGDVAAWRFIAATCAVALAAIIGMEALDALLAGSPAHGLPALLGGSTLLGSAITVVCGACMGFAVRVSVRALAEWEPALTALLVRLISPRQAIAAVQRERRPHTGFAIDSARGSARRIGKRGPPHTAPA